MGRAGDLPNELLEVIFLYFRHGFDGVDTIPSRFSPCYGLMQMTLVCKRWYGVAQNLLYRTIGLSSATQTEKLRHTLGARPQLGLLARGLHTRARTPVIGRSQNHATILLCCPNLHDLEFFGYDPQAAMVDGFSDALGVLTHLRTFAVLEAESTGFDFGTWSVFLPILVHWRNLEFLELDPEAVVHDEEATYGLDDAESTWKACLQTIGMSVLR